MTNQMPAFKNNFPIFVKISEPSRYNNHILLLHQQSWPKLCMAWVVNDICRQGSKPCAFAAV